MKNHTRSPILVILAGISVFAGCTVEEPPAKYYDTFQLLDSQVIPDSPPGCPKPPTLPTPTVQPTPPSVYNHSSMPIRGTAPGASMVGGVATKGNPAAVAVASSGTSFCLEVDLVQGINNIKLFALDARGCQSNLTPNYQVKYVPTIVQQDAGVTKPINLAKNAQITSKDTPGEGSVTYVNDGSDSSFAKFSFLDWDYSGKCDNCTWVRIDLGKAYTVSKFRVRWGQQAGSDYATCFSILTAKSTPAQDPDCTTNAGWTLTHKETTGVAVPKDISVQPATARYVALLMYENASSWLWENFQLAEFEVWGQDPNATTPPPPDKCR